MAIIENRNTDPDGKQLGVWRQIKHGLEEGACTDPVDLWKLPRAEYEFIRPYVSVDRVIDRSLLQDAYERATKDLAVRERLTRQLASAIETETDHRTAELMREFLDGLPASERALLGLRLLAEGRIARGIDELEREVSALRAELARR